MSFYTPRPTRRSFTARPILSADEPHADKHKMERFLHPGRGAVATVFAPIMYGPQPLLVFDAAGGGNPQLVATGAIPGSRQLRPVRSNVVVQGILTFYFRY